MSCPHCKNITVCVVCGKGYAEAMRVPVASDRDGWKEAAIAWEVCASIHREYAKGKDGVFKTRQADFVRHAEDARQKYFDGAQPSDKEQP